MKTTHLLPLALLLVFSFSCKDSNPSSSTDSSTAGSDQKTVDFSREQQLLLQGTWKRQSYPHGTIEVMNDQIKFNVGEGLAEPPVFQKYQIKKNCGTNTSITEDQYDFVLNTSDADCNFIKWTEKGFDMYLDGGASKVRYHKLEENNASQSDPMDDLSDNNPGIQQIKSDYQAIRQKIDNNALTKNKESFTCTKKDGNGYLTTYRDGEQIVLLEYQEGIGHTYTTKRIYLKDQQAFFVFETTETWSSSGQKEDGTIITNSEITEQRYYLEDGKILKKLIKSYNKDSADSDFSSDQIPNEVVENAADTTYPEMKEIEQLLEGNIPCI
ncbi:hypothetical protein [Nonlabens xiamenensis]|uniref:hypothetical protein n=1 Tax=Nonlabens xiamenensis TaxID=2341043 RepID=UPI000F613D5E|nr:hypothetical protein [Nonlabens xiamenensis]